MFLKNYNRLCLRVILAIGNNQGVNSWGPGGLAVKNMSGVLTVFPPQSNAMSLMSLGNWANLNYGAVDYTNYGCKYLWIGSGDALVDYDDYKLESPFTTSQVNPQLQSYGAITYDSENEKWYREISRAFQNISEDNIIIKEYGVCTNHTSSISSDNLLIFREVLNEFVTVAPNEFVTVTFKYELSEDILGLQ